VGWRKASGLETRLDDGSMATDRRSIGGGCADATESVCDDIDVSGENDSGAMLLLYGRLGVRVKSRLREGCDADKKLFGGAGLPRALALVSANDLHPPSTPKTLQHTPNSPIGKPNVSLKQNPNRVLVLLQMTAPLKDK
jgi:hypothetical protein